MKDNKKHIHIWHYLFGGKRVCESPCPIMESCGKVEAWGKSANTKNKQKMGRTSFLASPKPEEPQLPIPKHRKLIDVKKFTERAMRLREAETSGWEETFTKLIRSKEYIHTTRPIEEAYGWVFDFFRKTIVQERLKERELVIEEVRNWTKGKDINKDKLRNYLNKLKGNET